MSRRKEQTSSMVLKNLIHDLGLEEQLLVIKIEEVWKKMMGEAIGKHTKKIFIDNRTLFILLDSAVLRHELNLSQQKILTKINSTLNQNQFDKIKFI